MVAKGNRILATGYNTLQPSHLLKTETRHAEASAILKLLKEGRLHDLAGSTLYVSRFTRGGRVGLSRPCFLCHELINSVGIREVFYTTDEGTTMRYKV